MGVPQSPAPEPYDENDDSDIFWDQEYFDQFMPKQKGFITDLVYATRGMEIPTSFSVWNAIVTISSAVKREAWLAWYPRRLYANFYLILVAPPSVCKKSTSIGFVDRMLSKLHKNIPDLNFSRVKEMNILRNKSTPEALIDAMNPENRKGGSKVYFKKGNGEYMRKKDGSILKYERTSEITIIVPELETLLSRSKYNESMLQNLMDFYDCHDSWEYHKKTDGGAVRLKNMHTNLIGAVTPKGFREGMPAVAGSDGFLSRVALVYEPDLVRVRPFPMKPEGAPDEEELTNRLSWIAQQAVGEYFLSEEARNYYEKWYRNFKKTINDQSSYAGVIARKDLMMFKLSFIMHLQRYADDPEITVEDFKDAERVINGTQQNLDIAVSLINAPEYWTKIDGCKKYIKERQAVTRGQLMQNRRMTAFEVTQVINQIAQEGLIRIRYDGEIRERTLRKASEVYEWVETEIHPPQEEQQ